MVQWFYRHGCILLLLVFGLSARAEEPQPVSVQSRVFDIEYEVNDAALPLTTTS